MTSMYVTSSRKFQYPTIETITNTFSDESLFDYGNYNPNCDSFDTYEYYIKCLIDNSSLEKITSVIFTIFECMKATRKSTYNDIVLKHMKMIGFVDIIDQIHFQNYSLGSTYIEDFVNFTFGAKVKSFKTPTGTKSEKKFKDFFIDDKIKDERIESIDLLELIKVLRFTVYSLVFRCFNTYDIDEVVTLKSGKTVQLCNVSNHDAFQNFPHFPSEVINQFLTDLIKLYRFLSQFSYELTEFQDFFDFAYEKVNGINEKKEIQIFLADSDKRFDTLSNAFGKSKVP